MNFSLRETDLDVLNSVTKYPSIATYHTLNPDDPGILSEEHVVFPPDSEVIATEKINGANARIILTPDSQWLIGSREMLLSARGDLIANPAEGIVEALRDKAEAIVRQRQMGRDIIPGGDILVLYGEVYGNRIDGWQQYTDSSRRWFGFRLFDVMVLNPEHTGVLDWPRDRIAGWRSRGGQPFLSEAARVVLARAYLVDLAPRLFTLKAKQLPETLLDTQRFMQQFRDTRASLDGTIGKAEGIVLRTPARSVIVKARFDDYRRSLQRRQEKSR
jgi:hypothetical protein